jgi:hypothetical protein
MRRSQRVRLHFAPTRLVRSLGEDRRHRKVIMVNDPKRVPFGEYQIFRSDPISLLHAHLVPRIVSRSRHAVASGALAEEAMMHESQRLDVLTSDLCRFATFKSTFCSSSHFL